MLFATAWMSKNATTKMNDGLFGANKENNVIASSSSAPKTYQLCDSCIIDVRLNCCIKNATCFICSK